ncbi:MAG TPA: hypothetical protein VFQ61_32860 [Polyangiaceae bacterium]|nr:hypothetical protein [Polyangiaceae bacterium]
MILVRSMLAALDRGAHGAGLTVLPFYECAALVHALRLGKELALTAKKSGGAVSQRLYVRTPSTLLPRSTAITLLGWWFAAACACTSCGAGRVDAPATLGTPRRPIYKPGQSLEARLCECRECLDVGCCDGEPDSETEEPTADGSAPATETGEVTLGVSMRVCGRCVRRTWTVRGLAACEPSAPRECCSNTVRG